MTTQHVYTVAQRKRMNLILDTGCRRNVAGSAWHADMRAYLKTVGLRPLRIDKQEDFVFGSDRVDTSICCWLYPVGIHGHTGVLNIAEIDSNCPGLLSADTMSSLDVSVHMKPGTYDVGVFGVKDHKYTRAQSGHALIYVDDFGSVDKLNSDHWIENELPICKGTAKRLRKSINLVSEISQEVLNDKTEQSVEHETSSS